MATPEGIIQAYGMAELKKHGCLVRKISYEMRRGCPDHLVLVPPRKGRDRYGDYPLGPKMIFIEYKRDETIEPDPHQLREHERMRAAGADVRVIGSRQQVDALVNELFPEY